MRSHLFVYDAGWLGRVRRGGWDIFLRIARSDGKKYPRERIKFIAVFRATSSRSKVQRLERGKPVHINFYKRERYSCCL